MFFPTPRVIVARSLAEDGWVVYHGVNAFLQPGVAKREGFVAGEGGFDFVWGGCVWWYSFFYVFDIARFDWKAIPSLQ